MKSVLFAPLFNYKKNDFTGDNVSHYLLGKYLWHVCNKKKTVFHEPIYNAKIHEEVSISFVFLSEQPQQTYFKKPEWIDEFLVARDEKEINLMAKDFDFFMNQYRYRGAHPPETNCGYSPDLKELNLHLPAITYKSVFEENVYLDDLLLADKYAEFISTTTREIAPDGEPIIALHNRGFDPWNRHLPFTVVKYEKVLKSLLRNFPNHVVVLVGEAWGQYRHPRVKYLHSFINPDRCISQLGEHNACLQYILSAYFCRDAQISLIGISGFSLFIESIRPLNLSPPIPVFWNPKAFEGECTYVKLMEKNSGWCCHKHQEYKKKNLQDIPYQFGVHHFLYYSRDKSLLEPYCFDNPNTPHKILAITKKLADKHRVIWNKEKIGNESVKFIYLYQAYHFCYYLLLYVSPTLHRFTRRILKNSYLLFKRTRACLPF